MYQQVTLTVSDAVLKRAASLAAVVSRPVEKILSEALEIALPDVGSDTLPPIENLTDAEVLALTKAQMESRQNTRLSLLLDRNQRGTLDVKERAELHSLYQSYLRLWLRQSEALAEAVHRGLRQPLQS